ncbi:uncharacterized protein N7484_008161 [Penicillium longicatenatum]|uniref:uncharacterized protein n=1 Tax=Penicillium longicatenatum TaxID=1561947 RepID=UPI0025470729|nr:uncharacterized protein N7484_008161 [Penicillium longicatenatum]KAJ5640299.1 hypothetical protein N7484_008161 [Penicillium longicatenatum]
MSDASHQKLTYFLEQWKKLQIAVNEMAPYARMIGQVEDVLEENAKSKVKLAESHVELQQSKKEEERLNCFVQEMIEKFEKRLTCLLEKHKSSLFEMNTKLEEAKGNVATSRSDSEQSTQRCLSLERELESQRRQLSASLDEHKSLTSALGLVELNDHFSDRLDGLAMELHSVAKSAFLGCSDDKVLDVNQDKTFRLLVSSEFMSYERPIPISDSIASKNLRVATLEALITRELVTRVFVPMPSYTIWLNPISPKPDWDTMAKCQPLQEAIMRAVSSIVYSHDQQELEETKIAGISDRITSKLRPLLDDIRSFETELHPLLRDAFDIWRAVQRSPRRIVALADGKASLNSPEYELDEGVSITGGWGLTDWGHQ